MNITLLIINSHIHGQRLLIYQYLKLTRFYYRTI